MKNRYIMPAEWEVHERTIIEWPVQSSMVYPENYEAVCRDYAAVASALSTYESVTMIVNEDSLEQAKSLCDPKIELLIIPHNDAWCRDNGPTIIFHDAQRIGINWHFNAWGEKYPDFELDNKVASKVLSHLKIPVIDSSFVLEGGSIHVDGEGTLLTTRECLLHPSRNPDRSIDEIEQELKEKLGIKKILWLNHGLYGDETDGHIDNIACFIRPGTILIQVCHDKNDPNYEITQENLSILRHETDARGRMIEVIEVEQPPARYYHDERLTLSYLNFYIANNVILLPVFGDTAEPTDIKAKKLLSDLFPERSIVTINTSQLITEGGNIHCITQQIPKFK